MKTGKKMQGYGVLLLFVVVGVVFFTGKVGAFASEQSESKSVIESIEPENKTEKITEENFATKTGYLHSWIHMLDRDEGTAQQKRGVLSYGAKVPADIAHALGSMKKRETSPGVFGILLRIVFSLGFGFLVSFFVGRQVEKHINTVEEIKPPETDRMAYFWLGIIRNGGPLVSLFVLALISTFVFLLMAGQVSSEGRMMFQAFLGSILAVKACRIFSSVIFAPDSPDIRMVPLSDGLSRPLHKAVVISASALLVGLLVVKFIAGLGVMPQTITWVAVFLGSAVIGIFCYLVLFLKVPVCDVMQEEVNTSGGSWLKKQLFKYWHLPALSYLLLVWVIWLGQQFSGAHIKSGTFVISVLVIPIFFILNYLGKVLISSVVDSLGFARVDPDPENGIDEEEAERLHGEKRDSIIKKSQSVYSTILGLVIIAWVFSLWGVYLPFAQYAMKALFESLVAIGLALFCWRFSSSYIEKKIAEATPEEQEKEEESDDEFGGAVQRGRSHTLLPMVRKLIGTVLMVMVVLIVVSSFGVNIGPLLAGAGIIGLAIGFGAQKLVSDVLSGFFFLLDDAFRVGEYIQAGEIRGTVEAITLRNVMLRHHLGMLQVVPHSDLGAITNFMRGGIVIKFPLEFPYDTDIDKVRKIIKKVGQAMLEDPELGDDFIRPVKSQGVNEITNSVMVIRVKFTSKPGKQFMIKREAFRRITEALNAKGIYYAHRKVIVDFPEGSKANEIDDDSRKKLLEAGAAAALTAESSREGQQMKKGDPMEG